jgi:NDP-sugar pyrophosphorylase family protein
MRARRFCYNRSMQAVILAAGRGARMGSLTARVPKVLLEIAGKTLLEHKLDALPDEVDQVVLVVGYLSGMIRKRFGDTYGGKGIRYVEQRNIVGGTADALWCAKGILHDRFLVMYGDDLYTVKDVAVAARSREWVLVALEVPELGSAAKIVRDADGNVEAIVEREEHGGGPGFVNTGLYCFDARLFEYPLVPKSEGSQEYGLPQTALAASRASGIPLRVIEATGWLQITAPEDLVAAEEMLKKIKE